MARIANKKTTPASVKMLVIKSNNLDEFVKNAGIHAKNENYSSLDLIKLWNRKSEFRRNLKTIEADLKKEAAKVAKVAKAKVAAPKTRIKTPGTSLTPKKGIKLDAHLESQISKIDQDIKKLNELFAQLIVAIRTKPTAKPVR